MKYFDFCKNVALEKLDEYSGEEIYLCDLDYKLTEYENDNGSWYCSTYKAERDIKEWFDDLGGFVDYYKSEYGDNPNLNVFENPEGFHCLAVICGVADIVSQALCCEVEWNDLVELTPQKINAIKKKISKVRNFSWLH